jgi:2-oxoglutarate ferredoxin oxidoreductase subunit delta
MMKRKTEAKLEINTEWCKGCGICVAFCPKQVWELNLKDKAEAVRAENCIACGLCALRCPDLAIEVLTTPKEEKSAA